MQKWLVKIVNRFTKAEYVFVGTDEELEEKKKELRYLFGENVTITIKPL